MTDQSNQAPRRPRVPLADEYERLTKQHGPIDAPEPYPAELAETAAGYRVSDQLPRTPFDKLNAKPKDAFRMVPMKMHRALALASANAKLIFVALWSQHEEKSGRANGLLIASTEWLQERTGIGSRNHIADGVIELEVRGIVRVHRGYGGRGRSWPNMYLLTAFADALGNAPLADYETKGLPNDRPTANAPDTRAEEGKLIDARFNAQIEIRVRILRYMRNVKQAGEG